MSTRFAISPRDVSLLRLLSWTPVTTSLLLQASSAFESGGFPDERRLRERLQILAEGRLVRSWSLAQAAGGLGNYYKLTPSGFEALYGSDVDLPTRAFFSEVSPSLVVHTFRLAEAIVVTMLACHRTRVTIERFMRENELTFVAGDHRVQPDSFFRLTTSGRAFNLALEIDNSMASVDSAASNSIRRKLLTYLAYQDLLFEQWLRGGKRWECPRFRVLFLAPSIERAYHILSLAGEIARHLPRRLVYAAVFDSYVAASEPLTSPILLDHHGQWQAVVDLHPTAPYLKAAVRLPHLVASPLAA